MATFLDYLHERGQVAEKPGKSGELEICKGWEKLECQPLLWLLLPEFPIRMEQWASSGL